MNTENRPPRAAADVPGPRSSRPDVGRLAEMLDAISAELEETGDPDHRVVTGDAPEAAENRAVQETQASLARAAARALRGDLGGIRRANRTTLDDAQRARDHVRAAHPIRPAAADVPLDDLGRLARQALALTGSTLWAELAVPTAEGTVVTATAGHLPAATVTALADGPRAAVLRTGSTVVVDDAGVDDRWPDLRSATARAVLVLPLGLRGTVSFAATDAFDDPARAVAREIAAHGSGLLTGDAAPGAVRARSLVVTASTLLARKLVLDPPGGLDALLERATSAGSTVLDCARHVVDELGPPGDDEPTGPPEPATLRRALAFLEGHAGDDIDVADVAGAAGLGVRGLQAVFRRWRGTTPLGALRDIRLRRAHEQLQAADPRETTVADVAHRWYFSNAGRFSVIYRRRFHCSPSETLRA
ncbi:helix-turn-helix transcriptional regulator [Actinomycetospora aeridis]|uniref:Helix-turn-helix transcriptional regulator n=1 Tax=Actinomycetospora aeridis TaxID=3129231 RepID=A0ABU8NCM8_9PSEU